MSGIDLLEMGLALQAASLGKEQPPKEILCPNCDGEKAARFWNIGRQCWDFGPCGRCLGTGKVIES